MTPTDPKFSQDLAATLGKLNTELSDPKHPGVLFTLGSEVNWSDVNTWISTGSTLLDLAMTSYDKDGKPAGSGWACGRWYEVFGEEGMGKTTLVEHAFAETQKIGGIAGLIDSESKLYKPRAERIGINLQHMVLNDAPYVERGIESFTTFMEAVQKKESLRHRPVMYAWDTIASAPTKKEYEEGMYAGGQAEKARITRQMYRDLTNKLSGFNACFIMVNQVSDTMGGPYAKQTDTTGGRGAKYHASARLEMQRFGVFADPDNKDLPQGIMVRIKLVKSSLFKPFAEVELPFNFETGIDNLLSLVQFHTNSTKLIQNKGGRYYSEEFFGKDTAGKYLGDTMKMVRDDELIQDQMIGRAKDFAGLLWKKAASYASKKDEKE